MIIFISKDYLASVDIESDTIKSNNWTLDNN